MMCALAAKSAFACFSFLIFFTLFINQGGAQNFRGTISGTVTDSSGAVLPSANIKATNDATGLVYSAISSSAGEFSLPYLPLGDYTVEVSASGFQTLKINKVPVSAGQTYDLRASMRVSAVSSTIEVSAATLAVETSSTVLTTVLPERSVQDLPMNGRDFTQFLAMTPGFTGYPAQADGSMNGSRTNMYNWQIDGSDNNDAFINASAVNQAGIGLIAGVVLPIDAIAEVSTETSGRAEEGQNPGATTNLVLKSGTNELHGSAYYYNRNEFFAAQAPFAPPGSPKHELRNQNFGGSIGGPIDKNKLFYFVSYEEQKFVIANPGLSTEPSVAYQAAALQLLKQYKVAELPAAQTLLDNLWPADSLTGPASANNYFSPAVYNGYSHNGLAKLDYSINDKNRLSFRWFVGQGIQTAPIANPTTGAEDKIPYYFQVGPMHVQNVDLVYDRTLSAHLTNQVLVGVNYFNQVFNDANHSFDVVAMGFNTGVTNPALSGAPQICIGSFDCTGLTPPSGRNDVTGHIKDSLLYVKGSHSLSVGGEYRQSRMDAFNRPGTRGAFIFDGSQGPWSVLLNNPNFDANIVALADFMAGLVAPSAATLTAGNVERFIRVNQFSLYGHDAWQVTKNLNLNYGLRWEYQGPPHTGEPNLPVFDPNVPGGLAVVGQQVGNIFQQYWRAFSPRVGFAYRSDAFGGLVIRGGFGLYYDTAPVGDYFQNSVNNGGGAGVQTNPAGSEPVFDLTAINGQIVQNQPIFPPATLNSIIAAGDTVVLSTINQHFRPAEYMNYNLNIQKSLGRGAIFQIGYVGSQGRRLPVEVDLNQPTPSPTGLNQALRPYYSEFPYFGVIDELTDATSSNYNALQVVFRTQSWHRLTSQFSYAWSHSLDNASSPEHLPQNSFNLGDDYGSSDNDVRHNFKAQLNYQLPGSAHGPKWLTNGWSLTSNMLFETGEPFTVMASGDISGTGEYSDRADQVGNPWQGVSHQFNPAGVTWFNPNAFANAPAGTYGTSRRNAYTGPGYGSVDLSVLKEIPIKERFHAQFRVEMFNLFNRVNLAQPGTYIGSGLGVSSDTIGDASGAPGIGPGEPFNTQFALKLLW